MATPRKLVAALSLGSAVLALGGLPAAAAPPPPPETGAFCVNVPEDFGGFTDTAGTNNEGNIECLAFAGITTGNTATTYNPTGQVSRSQMALFIARLLDLIIELDNGSAELRALPQTSQNAFSDDDDVVSPEAHQAINRLAGAGIVSGNNGEFNPTDPVSRAQMTSFINNAQEFLSSGNPFTSGTDFFTDDEGSVHEDNINGIAGAGIAQGTNAAGTLFGPSGVVSRNQMASFLIRYLAVLFEAGVIDVLPAEGGPGNATIEVAPTDTATRIDTDADAGEDNDGDDERTYTASGLSNAEDFRVALVNCDNIVETEDGVFSFDEEGTTGLAEEGPNEFASIVSVNGTDAGGVQTVGAVVPDGGQIAVVVDAAEFGCVRPVFFEDAGADTRLEIDDDGLPTDDFGVGGELNSLPAELADEGSFSGATILFIDRDQNLVVVDEDPEADGGQSFINYDNSDSYFLVTAPLPPTCPDPTDGNCEASDIDEFEQLANVGDLLSIAYDENGDSDITLNDTVLGGPTIDDIDPGTTTALITLDESSVNPDATQVDIFLDEGDLSGDFDQADLAGSAAEDEDAGTPGFQITIDGLTPGTQYTAFAVQTVNGEESEPSTGVGFTTELVLDTPEITAVEPGFDSAAFTVDIDPQAENVRIYLVEGTLVGDFDDAALAGSSSVDEDPDTPGFQVIVTGLDPETQYSAFATQLIDNQGVSQESGESARESFTTVVEPAAVNLDTAVQNDVNDGSGSTDEVIATYAADVDCGDVIDAVLVAEDDTEIEVTECAEGTNADELVFTLETAINDGQGIPVISPEIEYTLTVATGTAVTAADGTPVLEDSAAFTY